jgi:hypothetical protein
MATRALVQRLGSQASFRYGIQAYDPAKLALGEMMTQFAGSGESGFAGPVPLAVARPMEQSTSISAAFPWVMQWQNNAADGIDWVFLADIATAAATRRIVMYLFNRRTSVWTWQGFITVTLPTATAYTIRGFRMTYDLYTAGTVSVSGTAVTGASTLWVTNKLCVGNRIGFGSTDPTQITTWYTISAIGSETGITLASTAGTLAGGTAYVIEDLRAVMATTNATTTNGGLVVVKGLAKDLFSNVGGTVPAATTVDSIRASYWLADATVVTNITATGLGIETKTSATSQMVYVIDGTANPVVFKYNIRATLVPTAGKDFSASVFILKTGSGGAVTGAIGQNNNGRLATVSHGPHSGVSTLYFTTATRVYAAPVSGITSLSTTWLSNGSIATEVPPGGANTFAATGALSSIEYASSIDKFVITTSATNRSYVTQYRTDAGQWDRLFGVDTRQIDQTTADSSITPVPSYTGGVPSTWSEGGLCYYAIQGTTAIINRMYALPLAVDWEYTATTNCEILLPELSTPEAEKYTNIFVQESQVLGGKTGNNLGLPTEPYRVSYRTSGISDDSGSWTAVDSTGYISAAGAASIQFRLEFRAIGLTCIPARVHAIGLVYEDLGTDSHYQPSVAQSSTSTKAFAWRFSTAFGSAVPALRVRLYNAVTGGLLLDDTTTAVASGAFSKSTNDGGAWGAYDTTDKANETTYIRYIPTTLADNIKVRALLTQN